jgi:hypothetical protein
MAKSQITSAQYEKLSDDAKKFYKQAGESDNYVLDIEDEEDAIAKITKAKQHEVDARKKAEQDLADAKARVKELLKNIEVTKDGQLKEKGDVEALEASWQKKLADREAELTGTIGQMKASMETQMKNAAVAALANKISTTPKLLQPHIAARVGVTWDDKGMPSVRVLDAEGKPSAMSMEDLGKEFAANADFKSVIKASDASGGAGAQTPPAVTTPPNATGDQLLSGKKTTAFLAADPKTSVQMLLAKHPELAQTK